MAIDLKNYEPALMQGANITVEDISMDDLTATGNISLGNAATDTVGVTGITTLTSANASALTVGANGSTNPVVKVDASASSVATGVSVTGAAAGSGVAVAAISSGTDENVSIDGKGAGVVQLSLTGTGGVNYKRQVTDTGGAFATPIVLTTAQSGRVILVDDAAGLDFTLPAIAAGNVGTHFQFCVTVTITSNSFRCTAASGDLLFGAFWIADFDTANTGAYFAADGTDDLIMTMDGSTKGGKKGTWVEFIATSATQWFVKGNAYGDGSLATPFS